MTQRAFFARGTRLYPIGTSGPFAPLDEESTGLGPDLLDAGWRVASITPCGQGSLVVVEEPKPPGNKRDRLFFVHGATAAPVERAPADAATHVPDYALFASSLALGAVTVASVPHGTGALIAVRAGPREWAAPVTPPALT